MFAALVFSKSPCEVGYRQPIYFRVTTVAYARLVRGSRLRDFGGCRCAEPNSHLHRGNFLTSVAYESRENRYVGNLLSKDAIKKMTKKNGWFECPEILIEGL